MSKPAVFNKKSQGYHHLKGLSASSALHALESADVFTIEDCFKSFRYTCKRVHYGPATRSQALLRRRYLILLSVVRYFLPLVNEELLRRDKATMLRSYKQRLKG